MDWKTKKNTVCYLIKSISEHYGGEGDTDDILIKEYCREIILRYRMEMDIPLACFSAIAQSLGIVITFNKRPPIPPLVCTICEFRPPFCQC